MLFSWLPLAKVTLPRLDTEAKAKLPILVTEAGMVMLVRPVL
jgi:hypothetical protein